MQSNYSAPPACILHFKAEGRKLTGILLQCGIAAMQQNIKNKLARPYGQQQFCYRLFVQPY